MILLLLSKLQALLTFQVPPKLNLIFTAFYSERKEIYNFELIPFESKFHNFQKHI